MTLRLQVTEIDTALIGAPGAASVLVGELVAGLQGAAATIDVGETTALPPGSVPTVRNTGTRRNAVLEFGIPQGDITPEARAAMEAAQAAQLAAENAQAGAEQAETNAAGSAASALTLAGEAEASATSALDSKQAAAGSADAAAQAALDAAAAQDASESARDASVAAGGLSEAARDAAALSAAAADASADAAALSELAAVASADAAAGAKDAAAGSAAAADASADLAAASAASIDNLTVGATTTGAPGTDASVTDTGTPGHPVLAFMIPRGTPGQDGSDGVPVEMRNSGTAIEWRYAGDLTWTQLVTIASITGQDGIDGREVELQKTATHIQWRLTGGAWVNLVALVDITGPAGLDGRTILNGTTAPSAGTGVDGDFYIDSVALLIYGPKAAGAWGAGRSIVGPTGPAGAVSGQTLFFDNTTSDLLLPSVTGTVYSFNGAGNPDIIHRSSGSFLTDGFASGMKIIVSGAGQAGNNGTFTIVTAAAADLTLVTANALTTEAAGATVTIKADRERITRAPASGTQQDESQSIVLADGDVTLDTYVTPSGYPGSLAIPAGEWRFHGFFYVSAGATCTVKFRVLKISATGAETTLFTTASSAAIASTSVAAPTEVQLAYTVAADIPLLTTDRIAVRVIGNNSSATARTLHFVYQGNVFASHVETSLAVAGVGVPVGGAVGQYLRKSSASDYDTGWDTVTSADVSGLDGQLAAKSATADLPVHVFIGPAQTPTASSAAVTTAPGSLIYGGYSYISGGAQNNYQEWEFSCAPGTYTLRTIWVRDTSRGIIKVLVDGSQLGTTMDHYGITANNMVTDITGITLTAGKHTIRFLSDTKNASSSAYSFAYQAIMLTRTGA